MYDEKIYIMWLNAIMQLNIRQKLLLMQAFGSAQAIWRASSSQLRCVTHSDSDILYNIVRYRSDKYLDKLYGDLKRTGSRFIAYNDAEFPQLLLEIPDHPLGLYIIGDMPGSPYKTAVVGSRNCTEYGASAAYNIGKRLAENDIVVVSGMAEGIDGHAHRGALDGGGKTIAVLGNGIDICYPSCHSDLRKRIIENGCILSEYPPGTRGTNFTFPHRNRIISGLSQAVTVVEAAKRSGSLITANIAADQNREVFAVPGNMNSPSSVGTNTLIKTGAAILTSVKDIFEFYGIESKKKSRRKKSTKTLEPTEKTVYDAIDLVPQSVDEIAIKTGLDAGVLQSTLTLLEMNGDIIKMSGQRYVRKSD